MSIVFDRVSFTYSDPERTEKQRRREEKRARRKKAARRGAFGLGSKSRSNGESNLRGEGESESKPRDASGPKSGSAFEPCGTPDSRDASESNGASELEAGNSTAHATWGTSPNAAWALKDISFSLENGEFFGIAGHTGSGKSTLIQHMNGLVNPTHGRVLVDGSDLSDKKAAQAARGRIGVVFQYPEHQLFAATVYDDVAFGPRNLGLNEQEVNLRVQQALQSVQLDFDELQDKSPFELSGGQQRRVAFAGVLAMNPEVLVLDEPVAGLDPQARSEFLDLIASLHARGITVVMVSHNMDDLARLCDRILILREGELFVLGTPAEVFSRAEELHAIGLDVPAPQKLANNLKRAGFPLSERLYDTATLANDLASLYQTRTQKKPSVENADAHQSQKQQNQAQRNSSDLRASQEPPEADSRRRPQEPQATNNQQPQNPQGAHHV